MIGRVLGSFRITGELGSGGMGEVYSAEHTLIGKTAAIKVLRRELTTNETQVGRFFHEAKATSAISHPGIVEVFDFGYAEDGMAYIVMELLQGETLRSRMMRKGALELDDALRLTGQIASALQAAHDQGIVHRDLKPGNLFVVPDPDVEGGDRARILDFGIAKLAPEESVVHTHSGAVVGTPVYMSPEQCSGAGKVDSRADLYALGCIMYEMVCGKRPFVAKGRGELLAMHLFDTPPPPGTMKSLPPGVDRLIMGLLEKEPDHRPASAAAVVATIKTLRAGGQPAPRGVVHTPELLAETLAPLETEDVASAASGGRGFRWSLAGLVLTGAGVVAAALVWSSGSSQNSSGDAGIRQRSTAAANMRDAAVVARTLDGGPPRSILDAAAKGVATNRWIRIRAPRPGHAVILGVSTATESSASQVSGLRASRKAMAPSVSYDVQQHEVTWAELDPWLARTPGTVVYPPAWLAATGPNRSTLPATGVPWSVAYDYCRALGGNLPTEEQWEYAARGMARRPHSWGAQTIDLARTRVYAGGKARLHPVTEYDQDRTPGGRPASVWGLLSNAREWTASLWRNDKPGSDESWVQRDGKVYRVVRGLPVAVPPPKQLPVEGAAFRDALCAAPGCLAGKEAGLRYVGFRCVRPAAN